MYKHKNRPFIQSFICTQSISCLHMCSFDLYKIWGTKFTYKYSIKKIIKTLDTNIQSTPNIICFPCMIKECPGTYGPIVSGWKFFRLLIIELCCVVHR